MSRNQTNPSNATASTDQGLPSALLSVAEAAASDQRDTFNDKVADAYRCGASQTDIVGAYAEGGLQRLNQGLPVISFRWTGQQH